MERDIPPLSIPRVRVKHDRNRTVAEGGRKKRRRLSHGSIVSALRAAGARAGGSLLSSLPADSSCLSLLLMRLPLAILAISPSLSLFSHLRVISSSPARSSGRVALAFANTHLQAASVRAHQRLRRISALPPFPPFPVFPQCFPCVPQCFPRPIFPMPALRLPPLHLEVCSAGGRSAGMLGRVWKFKTAAGADPPRMRRTASVFRFLLLCVSVRNFPPDGLGIQPSHFAGITPVFPGSALFSGLAAVIFFPHKICRCALQSAI